MSGRSCTAHTGAKTYEVEFVALIGKTAEVVTVPLDQIRSLQEDEITHARAMAATGYALTTSLSFLVRAATVTRRNFQLGKF